MPARRDLTAHQDSLTFPRPLEREFLREYGERQAPVLKQFFVLGILLYMAFSTLDYWALPITYRTAWALRGAFGTVMLAVILSSHTRFFRENAFWISAAWTFLASLSIILMIDRSRPSEAGYIFYAFGLLLTITAIYVPSSGSLLFPTVAGWVTVVLYAWVAIFRQGLLRADGQPLAFFVNMFFLTGMNVLGMILGHMLVQGQRRDFLQRRVIEEGRAVEAELRARADRLLLNVLPETVAERLKRGERVADAFDSASILFADIVDFTPFSSGLAPGALVDVLNEVFSQFDIMAERYGLQKIKTVGDCYMIAAGLPERRPDHAAVLVRLGLEMCEYLRGCTFTGATLAIRVGVNSGPVMAAVIGRQRFSYDLWGDTVNTASRMESHGAANAVQISRATYELVKDQFACEPRGEIEIKGKGRMPVWHVLSEARHAGICI